MESEKPTTLQVAADREYDETKTVLPAEVAQGVYVENPPSAEALKLMHLLISKAGGRMADDVRHELRLADIKKISGMRNHCRATLRPLFIELAGAVLTYENTVEKYDIIGGFIDQAKLDYRHEQTDDLLVSWWFGRAFREMAEKSLHWAILDRQTIFALSSKYSILLFQHIASMANMTYVKSKTFDVPRLRAVLGVDGDKLERFADFNRWAIKPAIDEVNQISRLNLTATPNKVGRTVVSVTISWAEKPLEKRREVKRELEHSKVGRKARLNGTAETPVRAFPAAGGIAFDDHWKALKRAAGCDMDNTMIAEKFRAWCTGKSIPLDARNIEQLFSNFCGKVGKV